eukprot:11644247-Heterocapsa_arctica.AAC.1
MEGGLASALTLCSRCDRLRFLCAGPTTKVPQNDPSGDPVRRAHKRGPPEVPQRSNLCAGPTKEVPQRSPR